MLKSVGHYVVTVHIYEALLKKKKIIDDKFLLSFIVVMYHKYNRQSNILFI